MDTEAVTERLVSAFLPFFWGDAPCFEELTSADLSHLSVDVTAVVAMPDPLNPTMHMFMYVAAAVVVAMARGAAGCAEAHPLWERTPPPARSLSPCTTVGGVQRLTGRHGPR